MNLSYLKYAVEVEKTGSITKAAQNFYMNQPHLSKIIRELERDLGCPIFDRTSRGMVPTRRGDEFLRYAKAILAQEEQIEALCVKNSERALEVSLSVPRATYISYAFTDYLKDMRAFPSVSLSYKDFTDCLEIVQGDIQNPSFTFEAQDASATGGNSRKTISIYDRGSQFEILRQIPGSYMWTSPVPYSCLESTGLIQKRCSYPGNVHKDILVYRSGYSFSKDENEFLQCLARMISRLSER